MRPSILSTVSVFTGAMLAISGMVPASAEITINKPETTGEISFAERNDLEFKNEFRIGYDINAAGLDHEQMRQVIESMALVAPNGLAIRRRDFSAEDGIVAGTTIDDATPAITLVRRENGKTHLVVNLRDGAGEFIVPDGDTVGVFSFDGNPVPHIVAPFSSSTVPAHMDLLLDRSGSMTPVIDLVKQAASDFMARLPKNTLCRATSFNASYVRHTPDYQPCVPGIHNVGWIQAGGGTNIYAPLIETYQDGPSDPDGLRLVVVVSDGLGQSGFDRDDVIGEKTAPTFVYWLGDYDEDRFKGIADTFIYGQQDMDALLVRYFGQIAQAIDNQYVITIDGMGAPQ